MHADSFMFGNTDMFEDFGIRVIAHDFLLPPLRPRKMIVPGRSGAYDFGAQYHDERNLRLECDSRDSLTKARLRELAYLLSKKSRIILGDEPDKYYLGRIYDPGEVEHIGEVVDEFTLTLTCDPYAYGATVSQPLVVGTNTIEYAGTAQTPTRIEIKNTGDTIAAGITLTLTERRDSY